MSVFVTSDEHYGHERIISLANRPFASVYEMNETIIARHNAKVPNNPNHTVIHVGDMFWQTMSIAEAVSILNRLHGRHAFIYGNHDELIEKSSEVRSMLLSVTGENKASGSKIVKWNKHKITLNHFAQRVWDGSHKGHWHVYGHSHGALAGLGKSFDIGVDAHDFTPWSMEEIEAEMAKREAHHTIDNTGAVGVDVVNECIRIAPHVCKVNGPCNGWPKAGSTVHEPGCECGFCLNGDTKFNGGDYAALNRMDV